MTYRRGGVAWRFRGDSFAPGGGAHVGLSCRVRSSIIPAGVVEVGKPGLNEERLGSSLPLIPGTEFCGIHGRKMLLELVSRIEEDMLGTSEGCVVLIATLAFLILSRCHGNGGQGAPARMIYFNEFLMIKLGIPRSGTERLSTGPIFDKMTTASFNHRGRSTFVVPPLLACQLISSSTFDGYLATDSDGREQLRVGMNSMFLEDIYWQAVVVYCASARWRSEAGLWSRYKCNCSKPPEPGLTTPVICYSRMETSAMPRLSPSAGTARTDLNRARMRLR